MYGVVLWSDEVQNRAVIWCEDHGDLAYFEAGQDWHGAVPGMSPGDLVTFDLSVERLMRVARNPRLVATEEYPTLASDLRRAGIAKEVEAELETSADASKIIPFRPALKGPKRRAEIVRVRPVEALPNRGR